MNIFKAFKIGSRSRQALSRERLPELYSFVDVAVGDNPRRHSIAIDAICADTFTTRVPPGLTPGAGADFVYGNAAGRFRFTTTCVAIDAGQAEFDLPDDVKIIEIYGAKRNGVRVPSMLPVHWRYAADGAGNGELRKGSMTDLSRSGAALVLDGDVKVGARVELCFTLKTAPAPLALVSEVVRTARIETSGKNRAGVRFLAVDRAGERVLDDFIFERQTLRRERGVV